MSKLTSEFIAGARDMTTFDRELLTFGDPDSSRVYSESRLRRMGYTFKTKKPRKGSGLIARMSGMTTITACRVYRAAEWESKSPYRKAGTMAHEMRHADQMQSMDTVAYATAYALDQRKRWMWEGQAYAQGWVAMLVVGYPPHLVMASARRLGDVSFRENYFMRRLDRKQLLSETIALAEWCIDTFKRR